MPSDWLPNAELIDGRRLLTKTKTKNRRKWERIAANWLMCVEVGGQRVTDKQRKGKKKKRTELVESQRQAKGREKEAGHKVQAVWVILLR